MGLVGMLQIRYLHRRAQRMKADEDKATRDRVLEEAAAAIRMKEEEVARERQRKIDEDRQKKEAVRRAQAEEVARIEAERRKRQLEQLAKEEEVARKKKELADKAKREREQREKEIKDRERREVERVAKEKADKEERDRHAKEAAEQERLAREAKEKAERDERERQTRLEAERLEQEEAEKARLAAAMVEQEQREREEALHRLAEQQARAAAQFEASRAKAEHSKSTNPSPIRPAAVAPIPVRAAAGQQSNGPTPHTTPPPLSVQTSPIKVMASSSRQPPIVRPQPFYPQQTVPPITAGSSSRTAMLPGFRPPSFAAPSPGLPNGHGVSALPPAQPFDPREHPPGFDPLRSAPIGLGHPGSKVPGRIPSGDEPFAPSTAAIGPSRAAMPDVGSLHINDEHRRPSDLPHTSYDIGPIGRSAYDSRSVMGSSRVSVSPKAEHLGSAALGDDDDEIVPSLPRRGVSGSSFPASNWPIGTSRWDAPATSSQSSASEIWSGTTSSRLNWNGPTTADRGGSASHPSGGSRAPSLNVGPIGGGPPGLSGIGGAGSIGSPPPGLAGSAAFGSGLGGLGMGGFGGGLGAFGSAQAPGGFASALFAGHPPTHPGAHHHGASSHSQQH